MKESPDVGGRLDIPCCTATMRAWEAAWARAAIPNSGAWPWATRGQQRRATSTAVARDRHPKGARRSHRGSILANEHSGSIASPVAKGGARPCLARVEESNGLE